MTDVGHLRLHAVIHGRVQGVGFRAFVSDNAAILDLDGWVRNTYRGDVEVVAEGPRTVLERLLNLLEAGPRSAHVTSVDTEWEPATGEFTDFHIRFS